MNRKILITGVNGFLGSNCVKIFEAAGDQLYGLDVAGTPTQSLTQFVLGTVSEENLQQFSESFDAVLHLAGTGTVGAAEKNPMMEWNNTVASTKNVLEYIRRHSPGALLLYASSAAVYGNHHADAPIAETQQLGPVSNYGKFKVEAETLCREYHECYGVQVNIVRFFSIYGEGLRKQLLWDFSCRLQGVLQAGLEEIPCFGTGEEARDFIHVEDAARLFRRLLDIKPNYEIVNCARGERVTVREVLAELCRAFGYTGRLSFDRIVRPADPISLIADIRHENDLGMYPTIDFISGVKRYANWFRENN